MSAALGNLSKLNCPRLHDISARLNYSPMRHTLAVQSDYLRPYSWNLIF